MLLDTLAVLELWDEPAAPPGGGTGGVAILRPNGAGAFSEWIPSSGTNWAATFAVGGAYVQTVTDGARDRYTIEDLPVDAVSVSSVTAWGFLGANGPGSMVRFTLELSGTESNGASFEAADGSYDDASTSFALAPGGVAWTVARVNALTAGPDAVSGAIEAPAVDAFWLAVEYLSSTPATNRAPGLLTFDETVATLDGRTDPVLPLGPASISLDSRPISVDLAHGGDAPASLEMDPEDR